MPESIHIPQATYWRLRAHLLSVELSRVQLAQAQALVRAVMDDLAATHGVAIDAEYQLDDATGTLKILTQADSVP